METKAYIVLASHLSDLQIETTMNGSPEIDERIALRLGFIKYLNHVLKGNFTGYINPEDMFDEYLKSI